VLFVVRLTSSEAKGANKRKSEPID
jgi:hypothetical protein